MSETRFDPWARRRARRLLLQALYQWQMSGADEAEIERQFREDPNFERVDAEFFHDVLRGVISSCAALDECLAPLLDRKVMELDRVELALLRMGVYELCHRQDVPFKVAIDEAVGSCARIRRRREPSLREWRARCRCAFPTGPRSRGRWMNSNSSTV